MGNFNYSYLKKENSVKIEISGTIDEASNFSKIDVTERCPIDIDVRDVTLISSRGINQWMQWCSNLPKGTRINFFGCNRVFMGQVKSVFGFLPPNSHLISFVVPYFCVGCKTTENLEIENKGHGFSETFPSSTKCSKCGALAELDIIEESYQKYLKLA